MMGTVLFVLTYFGIHAKTLLTYGKSTLISTFTMALNDVFLIFFWYVFFNIIPKVNGWGFSEMILLVGFVATSFGFFSLFFYGAGKIGEIVTAGELDYYLLKPKNVLLHTLIAQINFSSFGEFVFGIICLFISGYFSPATALLFFSLAFLSGVVYTISEILIQLPAFYLPKADILTYNMNNALLHFSSYPTTIFSGITQLFLYFIIPAFFISTLPVQIIFQFSIIQLLEMILFIIIYGAIVVGLFYYSLKRYESGNSIDVRG